jgi:hypothetical protein
LQFCEQQRGTPAACKISDLYCCKTFTDTHGTSSLPVLHFMTAHLSLHENLTMLSLNVTSNNIALAISETPYATHLLQLKSSNTISAHPTVSQNLIWRKLKNFKN